MTENGRFMSDPGKGNKNEYSLFLTEEELNQYFKKKKNEEVLFSFKTWVIAAGCHRD